MLLVFNTVLSMYEINDIYIYNYCENIAQIKFGLSYFHNKAHL